MTRPTKRNNNPNITLSLIHIFHYRRVNVGDAVKRGQMIGMLTDYFGTPTEKILSPIDGKVLFISESSAMSERDFVAAIGVGR